MFWIKTVPTITQILDLVMPGRLKRRNYLAEFQFRISAGLGHMIKNVIWGKRKDEQ